MEGSSNYLGAGGVRIEKPNEYYQRIDDAKKAKANKQAGTSTPNSSTRVNTNSNVKKSSPSKFEKIMQKNNAVAARKGTTASFSAKNNNLVEGVKNEADKSNANKLKPRGRGIYAKGAVPGAQKMLSPMDIKQMQYDAAKKRVSSEVKAELSKGGVQAKNANKLHDAEQVEKTGTDIALQQLAIEYEEQIYGILWNLINSAGDRDYPGGLGEEIFHRELVSEMQKYTNTGQMGQIAQSIYDDMKRENPRVGTR